MNKLQEVWLLELFNYFVEKKNYLRVNIFNKDLKQDKGDYWLVNFAAKYGIIHLSFQSDDERKVAYPMTIAAFEKIKEFVKIEKTRYLDISVSDNSSDFSTEFVEYVHLYVDKNIQVDLLNEFAGLDKVLTNHTNPERDLNVIRKDFVGERIKAIRKQRMKMKFCKSFVIPAIICTLVWLLITIGTKVLETANVNMAILLGAYYKAYITILNQWWRLLTSGFVHVSFIHLFCNMYALFNLASLVERKEGFLKTMAILIVSIIVGNLVEFAGGSNQIIVGLSAGIYGLWGHYIVQYIVNKQYKIPEANTAFFTNLYLNLLINLMPNVSFMSHLGGLVAGVFMSVIMNKEIFKALRINFAVCSLIICCILGYGTYKGNFVDDYYYGTDVQVGKLYKQLGMNKLGDKVINETYRYYINRGE